MKLFARWGKTVAAFREPKAPPVVLYSNFRDDIMTDYEHAMLTANTCPDCNVVGDIYRRPNKLLPELQECACGSCGMDFVLQALTAQRGWDRGDYNAVRLQNRFLFTRDMIEVIETRRQQRLAAELRNRKA